MNLKVPSELHAEIYAVSEEDRRRCYKPGERLKASWISMDIHKRKPYSVPEVVYHGEYRIFISGNRSIQAMRQLLSGAKLLGNVDGLVEYDDGRLVYRYEGAVDHGENFSVISCSKRDSVTVSSANLGKRCVASYVVDRGIVVEAMFYSAEWAASDHRTLFREVDSIVKSMLGSG